MFDAPRPAKYRDRAPRVVDRRQRLPAVVVRRPPRPQSRPQRRRRQAAASTSTSTPQRYDEMRPGCYDVDERVRDMNAGGQLAGLNFPNWTGFSGQVLNQGPDRDLNEVMIKAYNDWHVDEWCGAVPGPLHPVRHPPALRRRAAPPRCAASPARAVTRSRSRRTPKRCRCPRSTPATGTRCSPRAATRAPCCAATSALRHGRRLPRPTRRRACAMSLSSMMSIFSSVDLMWADFWGRFPDLKLLAHRGRHRLDPVLPLACRARPRRHSGWTQHRFPDGRARPTCSASTSCAASSTTRSASSCSTSSTSTTCAGSRTSRTRTARGRTRRRSRRRCSRPSMATTVVNKITHHNAMRHFQFDPFATRASARRARPRRCAPRRRTSTPSTRVGRHADDRDLESWRNITTRLRQ